MMTFRTISAGGMGKLIRAYLTENSNFAPEPEEGSNAAVLSKYYGRDARATWRPDMAPEVAAALGIDITKPPTPEALDRLFEAKRGDDAGPWSAAKRNISAYDLTISPEKSVSLAFAFAKTDEERAALLQAVWRANDRTMRYVAREIGWARRGDGGKDGAEPGAVSWASFMHFSARPTLALQDGPDGETYVVDAAVPGDPQVHIHNALFNAVVTASGHVGSLDTKELHGKVKEFGAHFQAHLANELDAMGIRLEYDQGEQAVAIASIPQAVRDAFSKGHKATVHKARQFAKEQGLDWNAIGVERKLGILNTTAANTRLQKSDGRPDQAVWDDTAARLGWQHETAITGDRREVLTDQERIARATEFAARHIEKEFATAAVIDQSVVRVHATRGLIGVGIKGEGDIEAVVRRLERDGVMVNGTRAALIVGEMDGKLRVTNSVQVKLERDMANLVYQASRAPAGAVPEATFRQAVVDSGIDFTGAMGKDQLAAAECFAFGGGLVFLEGVAGVGKTTRVLPAAVLAWQRDGRKVFGLSQAWRQADALKEAGVDETIAVHPFLAHDELLRSIAARIVDRHVLRLIKMWLKAPVEETDPEGRRRISGGKQSTCGTPQGGVISPLLANRYMNRFLRHWRNQGRGEAFRAHVVNYADDFVILSRGCAEEALAWTRRVMTKLGLTVNEAKTSVLDARQEHFDFLGYSFGPHHYRKDGHWYLGASPSQKSVQRLKARVGEIMVPSNVAPWDEVRARLNRLLRGWAGYFAYGTRLMAYRAADNHVYETVRGFLKRRHKVPSRGTRRFSDEVVFGKLGVLRLRRMHIGPPPTATR